MGSPHGFFYVLAFKQNCLQAHPTALGGSVYLTLIIQEQGPMDRSPWAF